MANLANFWQRGEALDYKNETGAVIPANTIIVMGSVLGVAGTDMAVGEVGAIHVTGVFEMPKKAATAIAAGERITYTEADGIAPASDGEAVYGYAAEAASADATVALVKLLG